MYPRPPHPRGLALPRRPPVRAPVRYGWWAFGVIIIIIISSTFSYWYWYH